MSHDAAPPFPGDPTLAAPEDCTGHFQEITRENPVPEDAKQAFIANRFQMMASHPALSAEEKQSAHDLLAVRPGGPAAATRPVPGGVGYGMFYTDAFRNAFDLGTKLQFLYLCPPKPGGNVTTWLYLTATNRASHGVEALVCYNGQQAMSFLVYDWAQPVEPWQVSIPYGNLLEYFATIGIRGQTYPGLALENATFQVQPGTWRNTVSLYNTVRGGYDLVYSFDYAATEAAQKAGWVGSWGPIVETFQDSYAHTEPMGAFLTNLLSQGPSGTWGSPHLLSANDATARDDGKGFKRIFDDPHFSWAVDS
ncbi:hypothetical protein [Solidesulfovibrio sp.]|uniref:hypothetical protein n=1 Tax=Solidesulfovibrio sp. TaxID=2910990 RepID=UPI0026359772|nr:hypothetical protein [Solidesulfovibrio sp.]